MKFILLASLVVFSLSAKADSFDYSKGTCLESVQGAFSVYVNATNDSFENCRGSGWWVSTPTEIEAQASVFELDQDVWMYLLIACASILLVGYTFRQVRRVMNL